MEALINQKSAPLSDKVFEENILNIYNKWLFLLYSNKFKLKTKSNVLMEMWIKAIKSVQFWNMQMMKTK